MGGLGELVEMNSLMSWIHFPSEKKKIFSFSKENGCESKGSAARGERRGSECVDEAER